MKVEKPSMYPVTTHSISSTLAPKLAIMFGIDTLTMLESSADMNVPTITTPRTRHLYPSSAGTLAAATVRLIEREP
jgi:hypothetical protein